MRLPVRKIYKDLYPDVNDFPISRLYSNRDKFVAKIKERALSKVMARYDGKLEEIIARTIYYEQKRVKENPWKVDPRREDKYWKKLKSELKDLKNSVNATRREEQADELIKKIINLYAEEIIGGFKPKSYLNARIYLKFLFNRLLDTATGIRKKKFWGLESSLEDRLRLYGDVDKIRGLFKDHTIVVVPTHFSNLDSILIGYALDHIAGLPGFSYGAGLNLYDSEIVAYFINRLGAYRVDRRKKSPVYVETLKSMSTISLLEGTNSLFFPGGTRSRSGKIDQKLKLGLLGTAVESQRILLQEGSNKKIVIVPLILSYNFVLEAGDLIENHLKKVGEEKYLLERGQSFTASNVLSFAWKVFKEESEIILSLGDPIDVLGNKIQENGESVSENGEVIDIKDYFATNEVVDYNKQRELVYTSELSEAIVQSFFKYNVVVSSQIVAYAAFKIFEKQYGDRELMDMMNMSPDEFIIPINDYINYVEELRTELLEMEQRGEIILSENIRTNTNSVIEEGLRKLGSYHVKRPLVKDENGNIISKDLKVLLYYHNRLEGYELDERISLSKKKAQLVSQNN